MNSDLSYGNGYRFRTKTMLYLCPATLFLLLLTSCGQTQNAPTDSKIIEPLKHPVINLVMIGIKEDFGVASASKTFPVGSRFCLDSPTSDQNAPWMAPSIEPQTAAGTVLPIGHLLAWFADLEDYGSATSHLAMQLAAVPQKTASVSEDRAVSFTPNWTFDRSGARKKRHGTSRSGAIVNATPTISPDPDILNIALKCHVSDIQLQPLTVAHGARSDNMGDAVPMKIDLPSRTFQDLTIEFSLEYDHAIILAHQIARSRAQPTVRQHVLYLAVLTRSPVWPKEQSSLSEPLPAPEDALVLYWPQYPSDVEATTQETDGTATSKPPLLKGISREVLLSRLENLPNDGISDSRLLGVALARNTGTTFDTGGERGYVCGVVEEPSSRDMESQRFDVRAARSGINLQCTANGNAATPDITVNAYLAATPQIQSVTREMPSFRRPLQSGTLEKYTFQTATQQTACLEQSVRTNDDCIWEITLPFQTATNGTPIQSETKDPTTWGVLYYQRSQEPYEVRSTIQIPDDTLTKSPTPASMP